MCFIQGYEYILVLKMGEKGPFLLKKGTLEDFILFKKGTLRGHFIKN